MLLNGRDLGKVDLNAHIAAGDHDAVRNAEDLLDVVDAFLVFDLGHDLDLGIVLFQQVADLKNVAGAARKAGRDPVEPLLDAEQDVLLVALAHIGHRQVYTRHVDALFGLDDAVVHHGADDVGIGHMFDVQLDQAVVKHDAAAGLYVVGQLFIGDGADLVRALHRAGGQGELLAGHELLGAVFEHTGADLGALCVEHRGHGHAQLGAQGLERFQAAQVLRMVSVGEVEAGDVHAVLDQLAQNALAVGSRAKGANDLCFTHSVSLSVPIGFAHNIQLL